MSKWRKIAPASIHPAAPACDPFVAWKSLRPKGGATCRYLVELQDGAGEPAMAAAGLRSLPNYRLKDAKYRTALPLDVEPAAGATVSGIVTALVSGEVILSALSPGSVRQLRARRRARVSSKAASRPEKAKVEANVTPPVIGVIDDGCAFLNKAFRGKPKSDGRPSTRFIAVWDQQEGAELRKPWWGVPPEFEYGREILADQIEDLLAQAGAGERFCYGKAGAGVPKMENAWSHGTHVLGIAAATDDPFTGAPDKAGESRLIAVQIPPEAVARTHGVWLNAYVLDGLHYILARAPQGSPVIVNISLAGNLGPHDGSSLLERAIDDLVLSQQGRLTVVLAVGNMRRQRMHACRTLARGEYGLFNVSIRDGDRTPNFVDFWIAGKTADDVEMVVSRQIAAASFRQVTIKPGEAAVCGNANGSAVALAALSRSGQAPNGLGVQAFLGTGPTRAAGNDMPADAGVWTIAIANKGKSPAHVHAWIARDDIPQGYPNPFEQPQLTFEDTDGITTSGTISSLAGGRQTIVVGGYRMWSANQGRRPTSYPLSGEGGTASQGRCIRGPDLCGPAQLDRRGVPDVWFFSDEPVPSASSPRSRRQRGTSLAAAFATRRMALVLFAHGRPGVWMDRQDLLVRLKADYPTIMPTRSQGRMVSRASKHWLGI